MSTSDIKRLIGHSFLLNNSQYEKFVEEFLNDSQNNSNNKKATQYGKIFTTPGKLIHKNCFHNQILLLLRMQNFLFFTIRNKVNFVDKRIVIAFGSRMSTSSCLLFNWACSLWVVGCVLQGLLYWFAALKKKIIHTCIYYDNYLKHIYRGYYMAAQRYQISLELTREIFFQHEKRNFVSPSGHVMFYLLYKHQWNTKPFHFNSFLVWKAWFIM